MSLYHYISHVFNTPNPIPTTSEPFLIWKNVHVLYYSNYIADMLPQNGRFQTTTSQNMENAMELLQWQP